MQVKVRPLNAGETFCCSIKKAKEVFRDTINFESKFMNAGIIRTMQDICIMELQDKCNYQNQIAAFKKLNGWAMAV